MERKAGLKLIERRIPTGFRLVVVNGCRFAVTREGLEDLLTPAVFFRTGAPVGEKGRFYGRGWLFSLALSNGERAVVRPYRHGGALRWLTHDLFFTWPPRPVKELIVAEEARRREVPTPEVLGAGVERFWGPLYRGWLVTRELEGAEDLWSAMQSGLYAEADRLLLLRAAARSVRLMHARGIYHQDLHLKNILVRREAGGFRGYLIDFDKAIASQSPLPSWRARRNLRRLLRSVRKLDPLGEYVSEKAWGHFMSSYGEDSGAAD